MDEFTKNHLNAWIDSSVYPEDQEAFFTYAFNTVNEDSTYDWDWSVLYQSFLRNVVNV